MITTKREGMLFHHMFLMRLLDTLLWTWEQPVHERIILVRGSSTPGNRPMTKGIIHDSITMVSGNDGGARKRDVFTFIRDAMILEKYINTPNENKSPERLTYYLIQSYFSAKHYELAEKYIYKFINDVEKIQIEKYNELSHNWTEVHDFLYFAHFLLSQIYIFLEKPTDEKYFQIMMKGLKYNTKRLEIPYLILKYLRLTAKDKYLGYYLFKQLTLDNLQSEVVPVYPYTVMSCYQFDFYEEMSVVAIFNKDYVLFKRCVERCNSNLEKMKNLHPLRLKDLNTKLELIKQNKW
jgi:hypothetical protein